MTDQTTPTQPILDQGKQSLPPAENNHDDLGNIFGDEIIQTTPQVQTINPISQPTNPVPAPQPIVETPPIVNNTIPIPPISNPQVTIPTPTMNPISQPTNPVPAPQPIVETPPIINNTIPIPPVSNPQVTIPHPVTPPPLTVKKGSKVSPLGFFIGCGIFGFIIIGAISLTLYFAIQNPSKFQGIIGIDGIKTGLKLFTGLFFGILFLGGFIGSIFNLYKIITTKIGSKIKYIIGIILSIMLLGGSVIAGMVSFNKINEIIGTSGDQNSLLLPSIQFKDRLRPISEGYPIIAPTKIFYGVNSILLSRFLTTNFTNTIVNTLTLDCGNNLQKLPYNANLKQFEGSCLYMKKGNYPITIIANITDQSTHITSDKVTNLGDMPIISEISFIPSDGSEIQLSDAKDEMIIGKAPTKLEFDTDKLFSDLKLSQYHIKRDLDGDNQFDKTDITKFAQQFRTPQVQTIAYTLPDLPAPYNSLIYQFDFRVLQSDVPICTLSATPGDKSMHYTIDASFDKTEPAITNYLYKIKNLATGKFVTAPGDAGNSFSYDFPAKGSYIVYLDYMTEDGKSGKCETDTIDVGASDFIINYTAQYKGPNDTKRQSFTNQSSGALIMMNANGITTRILPARIQLTLNSIIPPSPNAKKEVKLDDQFIQSPDGKTYEITLQNATHEKITIHVYDPITKADSTILIPITIIQKDIIGDLKAFPDTVGISPFEVTLDASTTKVTDKDDEIIYFSWDFGDGKKVSNASQARTAHTYTYDETNQNGTYTPSVTVTTKKGKKATFSLIKPILVKKPNMVSRIVIDSHPAQIAEVGDKVEFSLQTDGNPSHISRDFGTEQSIECDDRSCTSVPMFFYKAGTYTIKATTTYKDLTTSIATTKLIVEEK